MDKYGIAMIDLTTLPDFERAYREWLEQVNGDTGRATDALQQLSILRLAGLCKRWHQWQARLLDEATVYDAEGESSKQCWPSFIDRQWCYDDLAVVPLTTPWQLQEEGSLMQHCVGSYASHCLFYGAHIFSIRDKATGKPLSTFELFLDDGGSNNPYELMQHYGYRNIPPPAACQVALEAFLQHLRLKVSAEQLREIRWQQYQRCQHSNVYQHLVESPSWSRRMIDGFRELLQECPALLGRG